MPVDILESDKRYYIRVVKQGSSDIDTILRRKKPDYDKTRYTKQVSLGKNNSHYEIINTGQKFPTQLVDSEITKAQAKLDSF